MISTGDKHVSSKLNLRSRRIEKSDESFTSTSIETITPKIAAEWLKTMVVNRPLTGRRVLQFGLEMEAGTWVVNGESIKFNAAGNLIDGQHRLEACVLSGTPFNSYVIRGISDERAFATIDVGKTRTHGDIFSIAGFTNPNNVAATAMLLYYYKNNLISLSGPKTVHPIKLRRLAKGSKFANVGGEHSIPKEQLLEFASPLKERLAEAVRLSDRNKCGKVTTVSIAAFCYMIFREKDEVAAQQWIVDLGSGAGLAANDPLHVVRERLLSSMGSKIERLTRWSILALLIRSWNLRRAGKKVKSVRLGDEFPKAE